MAITMDKPTPHLLYLVICATGLIVIVEGRVGHFSTTATLYNSNDPIVQLVASNFDQTILHSDTAWIVEFYATWCGHCRRFAPIYKQYSRNVKDWHKVVRIASIACSDPKNNPVCSSQNIKTFPTIKFFPQNLSDIKRGHKLQSVDFDVSRLTLYSVRLIEQYVPNSDINPSLKLFRSIAQLRQSMQGQTPHLIAILEEDGDSSPKIDIAKLVIMDLSSLRPRLMVGRLPISTLPDPDGWSHPLPAIVAIHSRNDMVRFLEPLTDRGKAVALLKRISEGPNVFSLTSLPSTAMQTTTLPTTICTTEAPTTIPNQRPEIAYGMYQDDFDANIYYSLWNEVPSRTKIKGKTLVALKDYIGILSKYHPGNRRLKSYLLNLHTWIQGIGASIKAKRYLNLIEKQQTNSSYVMRNLNWMSCKGSSAEFRGYPCSLWMTFHAMTVAAYEAHLQNPSAPFSAIDVLNIIRSYVKNFFGCRTCVQHFLKMSKHMRKEVKRPEDVVLWLWKAHNKVNHRLHNAGSEDPYHPKITFPSATACPRCRLNNHSPNDKFDNDTRWDEEEVLKFLRKFYSPIGATVRPTNSCSAQSTPWSGCSVSCGTGVSTRMSSENTNDCTMQMEMRICQVRRCDVDYLEMTTNLSPQQCASDAANMQEASRVVLSFNNCTTNEDHIWRYCGLCPGYCCEPISDATFWADMTCVGGHHGRAQVMWIERCRCRPC